MTAIPLLAIAVASEVQLYRNKEDSYMSYGRKDVRGYVRASNRGLEEIPEKEKVLTYEEYVKATVEYERQFFNVLGLSLDGHLHRVSYRVAHSGRHQDSVWKAISKQLRKSGLPSWELLKLRQLGLEVAKAYKALAPFLKGGFWRG